MAGPMHGPVRINQEQICLIVGLLRKSRDLLPLHLAIKQRQETILFRLGNSAAHAMHNHGTNRRGADSTFDDWAMTCGIVCAGAKEQPAISNVQSQNAKFRS